MSEEEEVDAQTSRVRRKSLKDKGLLEALAEVAVLKIQQLGPALLEGIQSADGTEGASLSIRVAFLPGGSKSVKRFEVKANLSTGTSTSSYDADIVNDQLVMFEE